MLFYALKCLAMNRAISKFSDGLLMGSGRVALVLGKTKLRVVRVVFFHQPVTGDFGHNRCGRLDPSLA